MWTVDKDYLLQFDAYKFFADDEDCYEYCRVKHDVADHIKPKRILEIGIGWGYSAYSFLSAAPDAYYLGIDINDNHRPAYLNFLSPFNVETVITDSQRLTDLHTKPFDLIHVDGDHSYNCCLRDLGVTLRILNKTGGLLVDDADSNQSVAHAIKDFMDMNPQLTGEFIKSRRGDYLIRYK